jgi:hypothetical protein
MGRGAKNFCFTDYVVDLERQEMYLKHEALAFTLFSLEEAPTTGKLHLQGVVCFKKEMLFKAVCKMFPITHWLQCKGSLQDNEKYCSKGPSHIAGPWSSGTRPNPGERKDLQALAQMVVDGADMITIARAEPAEFVRHAVGLQRLALHFNVKRTWEMEILVYHGDTGTGKTRKAFDDNPTAYFKPKGDWWDAYDQQECVIWDEFAHDIPISFLLRVCDRYPLMVPFKGGFVNFGSKRIIFTSNIPFEQWYPDALAEHRNALRRRITRIVHFNRPLGTPIMPPLTTEEFTPSISTALHDDARAFNLAMGPLL